jgi:hypothetical protein
MHKTTYTQRAWGFSESRVRPVRVRTRRADES